VQKELTNLIAAWQHSIIKGTRGFFRET